MNHRIINLCILAMLGLSTTLLKAQQSPLLDNHRWQEYSYGVSILPPLGAKVHKRSVDDAIVRISTRDGYAINLFIKESQNEMELKAVRREALEQMAGAYPSATVLEDVIKSNNKREQLALHFFLPRTNQGPWVTAQTFVQVSPTIFVLFQLESPKASYELATPVYDAMINSLQLTDPRQLLADREKQLDAGQELLKRLKFDKLKDRLIAEQWFRFVEGDRDIGYMRILQDYGKLDDRKIQIPSTLQRMGYKIQVMARMELGETLYDSVNISYVSEERDEEIWSIRTTERPRVMRTVPHYRLKNQQQLKFDVQDEPMDNLNSWVETGLMSHHKIQLTRREPSSDRQFEWDIPPKAYLTQVELYLLPLLLADEQDGTWGFYAYHPNSGKISFRTERLEHKADGRYVIYSRLTPEDIQEQITEYDRKGNIIERILAGGRKLIPAQRHQVEALWPQFVK